MVRNPGPKLWLQAHQTMGFDWGTDTRQPILSPGDAVCAYSDVCEDVNIFLSIGLKELD